MSSTIIDSKDTNIPTWGYHVNSGSATIEHAAQVSNAVRYGSIAYKVTVFALAAIAAFISGPLALGLFVITSLAFFGAEFYSQQQICETAGLVIQNPEQFNKFQLTPEMGDCEALPTEHCADTEQWRKKLLEAAQENIVISGNYCGGNSFVEFLNDIEAQLVKKKALKVVIISSPKFLKGPCKQRVKDLLEKYPERFSLVKSPDIWHISPGIKKSTNHTKCMVIDYGKYFILGGSGIKDNFANTGLENLTKEQFLKQAAKTENTPDNDGLLGMILPGSFRDMDFVFKSKYGNNSVGRQVYKQMLLLSYRWEQYNKMIKGKAVSAPPAHLAAFDGVPSPSHDQDSVTMQLMKTPCPHWAFVRTTVAGFEESDKKAQNVAFKVLASGPEQRKSHFAEELLLRIKSAQESIAINHMYFHPTNEIMNALIDAANRGVKIKIITCGVYENCPMSHHTFGPRNKSNCTHLVQSVKPEHRVNVEIYEFQQRKIGNHKKAIIIDDYVIAGSSNLGYKSLVTTSDHELNFIAKSRSFADKTMEVFQTDINHSHPRSDFSLSFNEKTRTFSHESLAFLIG